MKTYFFILLAFFGLFSCKKDKLTGDKSIFVGKWEWFKSDHTYGYCTGDPTQEETITPDTDGFNYSIEFLEKGIVRFYENGKKVDRDRLIFSRFVGNCGAEEGYCEFGMALKGGGRNHIYKDGAVKIP